MPAPAVATILHQRAREFSAIRSVSFFQFTTNVLRSSRMLCFLFLFSGRPEFVFHSCFRSSPRFAGCSFFPPFPFDFALFVRQPVLFVSQSAYFVLSFFVSPRPLFVHGSLTLLFPESCFPRPDPHCAFRSFQAIPAPPSPTRLVFRFSSHRALCSLPPPHSTPPGPRPDPIRRTPPPVRLLPSQEARSVPQVDGRSVGVRSAASARIDRGATASAKKTNILVITVTLVLALAPVSPAATSSPPLSLNRPTSTSKCAFVQMLNLAS